jgi:hypothetical protein
MGDAPPEGTTEVTFIRDGKMFGIRPEGAGLVQRCLAEMEPIDTGPILWGPQGDRYLIGNKTFVIGDTRATTGFADNQIATWSAPKGTAILRVDPQTKKVAKRNNVDDPTITSLSVMSEAYDALYHPAGRNIAVVGRTTPDSTYGIWLITNDGDKPTLVTRGEDAKRLRLLGWDSGGSLLNFYAEHLDGTEHLHTIGLPGLNLGDVAAPGESARLAEAQVRVSGGYRRGDCETGSVALSLDAPGGPVTLDLAAKDARLISYGNDSFIATRTDRCDGPEDLWGWRGGSFAGKGTAPAKLVAGVTNIAVRYRSSPPLELPDDITAQAPG